VMPKPALYSVALRLIGALSGLDFGAVIAPATFSVAETLPFSTPMEPVALRLPFLTITVVA